MTEQQLKDELTAIFSSYTTHTVTESTDFGQYVDVDGVFKRVRYDRRAGIHKDEAGNVYSTDQVKYGYMGCKQKTVTGCKLAEEFLEEDAATRPQTVFVNGECKVITLSELNPVTAKGIEFKSVDGYGGEGKGDDYWSVYEFTKNGVSVFVKFYGSYSSYVGSEYEDFCFVNPVTVTKIEYR